MAAETPETPHIPTLDEEALNTFTMADISLQRELFDMFFDAAPTRIAQLQDDLRVDAVTRWGEIGHTMKGAAAALGLKRLARAAIAVQDARRPSLALLDALIAEETRSRAAAAAYLATAEATSNSAPTLVPTPAPNPQAD